MDSTSSVIDTQGRTLILLIKNILPPPWVQNLESVSCEMAAIVRARNTAGVGYISRGKHAAVRFGAIIERGGSGKICHSADNVRLKKFVTGNRTLWMYIAFLFALLCPQEAKILLSVPEELRIFGHMFTAGYWNLELLSNLHRDTRDWRWCCAVAFGDFEAGLLDFPVINTSVGIRRCDICFFWSKSLFHTVKHADINRQTFILTNHTAVIRRYNKEVDHKRYDHL